LYMNVFAFFQSSSEPTHLDFKWCIYNVFDVNSVGRERFLGVQSGRCMGFLGRGS